MATEHGRNHRPALAFPGAIHGKGLFEPQACGIEPVSISTACWRGYYCTYRVERDELLLVEVNIGLSENDAEWARRDEGPLLFGVRASYDKEGHCDAYAPLEAPVRFTGGLLLGADFITEFYEHMGFHPAWKYRKVRELVFDEGRLTQAFDRSATMRAIRTSLRRTT